MLTFSQAQFARLRELRLFDFHARLQVHLERGFPARCRELGSAAVAKSVADGVRLAGRYGAESERDICKFIESFYMLHFDLDQPELAAWVAAVLASTDLDPGAKIAHVHATVKQAFDQRALPMA